MAVSPIDIQVYNKILSSIAEEMGLILARSAFSSNIKERRDFSCAIFDKDARLLAQAAHIPVHLGAMPDTVRVVRDEFNLSEGDVIITNDPFKGGTHLPDITLVSGVFHPKTEELTFYLAVRAHHADVGANNPGSMALTTSIDEEGVLIPPSYFSVDGEIIEDYLGELITQMRNPRERAGDLRAQVASLLRGEKRLHSLMAGMPKERLFELTENLLQYGNRFMSATISEIPNGTYEFLDYLDDDGIGKESLPIKCRVTIKDNRAEIDFTGTSRQVKSCLNATLSVTRSAVYYCFFCLVGEGYPVNAGSLEPIRVKAPKGTLLNPHPPAPVAAGNVETSQRIVDCVFGALSRAIPQRIPAASCGSMNNVAMGGEDLLGKEFTYYETIGGGMGARPGKDGLSGVQVHMTNTLNTPIEALEQTYPMLIERYAIRDGSGGDGKYRGGDGLIRRYRFLLPARVSLLTERRKFQPYGLLGGSPGKPGENRLYKRGKDGYEPLPGKCVIDVFQGDSIEIRTPGGGGYGKKG